MQVIEEIIYQKTAQGLDWLFSVWWYWLPAGIGFLFRFGLLKYKIWVWPAAFPFDHDKKTGILQRRNQPPVV